MDDPLCLRTLHTVCIDMGHNVMTDDLFALFRHIVIDIVGMFL